MRRSKSYGSIPDKTLIKIFRLAKSGLTPKEIANKLGIVDGRRISGVVNNSKWKEEPTTCKRCRGKELIKYGFVEGQQKYKCTACGDIR